MSRIGLKPIKIEEGVTVLINDSEVTVTGPKGEIKVSLPADVAAEIKENEIFQPQRKRQNSLILIMEH